MKVFCVDGIDNTGKTWIVTRLKELHPEIATCGFPSDRLANSSVFEDMAIDPIVRNKMKWLAELYNEEYVVLKRLLADSKIVVVDRLWVSSLLYQGDGEPHFFFESMINALYSRLMCDLKIKAYQVTQIILKFPLVPKDEKEENITKRLFDSKQKWLFDRMEDLLCTLDNKHYFRNIHIFAESKLQNYWTHDSYPPLELIQEVQNKRIDVISGMIMSNEQKSTSQSE